MEVALLIVGLWLAGLTFTLWGLIHCVNLNTAASIKNHDALESRIAELEKGKPWENTTDFVD